MSSREDGRIVVLVVEDESIVREQAVELVEEAGFAPVAVADADTALAVLESRDDVGIVFSDIHMPGSLSGLSLAVVVQTRWPDVHVVLASGGHAPIPGQAPAGVVFLMKPYTFRDLANILRSFGT